MTAKQYIAILRRTKGRPADMRTQVSLWPYPQASRSCIEVWRESWRHAPYSIPASAMRIPVINGTDIVPHAPSPREVIAALAREAN